MSDMPPYHILDVCVHTTTDLANCLKATLAKMFNDTGGVDPAFIIPDFVSHQHLAIIELGGVGKDRSASFMWHVRGDAPFCGFVCETWCSQASAEDLENGTYIPASEAEDRTEKLMVCIYEGRHKETLWFNDIKRDKKGNGTLQGWYTLQDKDGTDVRLEGRMVEAPPGDPSDN